MLLLRGAKRHPARKYGSGAVFGGYCCSSYSSILVTWGQCFAAVDDLHGENASLLAHHTDPSRLRSHRHNSSVGIVQCWGDPGTARAARLDGIHAQGRHLAAIVECRFEVVTFRPALE